jgi:hypothetical protein
MKWAETRLLHGRSLAQELLGCGVVVSGGGLFRRFDDRMRIAKCRHARYAIG